VAYLSAASHDANQTRVGSSSGRRCTLVREKSRIEDAVATSDRGYGWVADGRRCERLFSISAVIENRNALVRMAYMMMMMMLI
jgi:hypothetical protein